MFYLLFGNYLVERNVLKQADNLAIKHKVQEASVKLGLIAVSEGLLTVEQADEINQLQVGMDKRFGDIAVDKGYLTHTQVTELLSLQENTYLKFIQLLVEHKLFTLNEITNYLKDYQSDKGYTDDELTALKSGDNDEVLKLLISSNNPMYIDLASLAVRDLIRFIDCNMYITNSYMTEEYDFQNLAIQAATGDHHIHLGFSGNKESLLMIANIFADEEFEEIDADSYDAICEFINCINGLFATKLSENDIEIDMLPPYFYANKKMKSDNLCVVTLNFKEYTFDLVISIDSSIEFL